MSEFQSWNRRTKQWVYFKGGQIKAVSGSKHPGVPVRKDKPGAEAIKGKDADVFNPPKKDKPSGRSFHLADLWD